MPLSMLATPRSWLSRFVRLNALIAASLIASGCGGGGGDKSASPTSPSTPSLPSGPGPVAVVTMSAAALTIDVNQRTTITATVRDAAGTLLSAKTVAWTTTDATIVDGTVNGNSAEIRGVAAGSATVNASVDGVTGSMAVQVRAIAPAPVATVTIAPASAAISVGESLPLVATLKDANGNFLTGRAVAWVTSNTAIVNGVVIGSTASVTAVAPGVATITATSEGRTGAATITVVSASAGVIPLTCTGLAGGLVYGYDGQYLGRLTNQFDTQSILNQFGAYGSQFSSTSMYNQFSQYGSQFASFSAYNQFANTPPQLYVSGRFAAYVTKNQFKPPSVDPTALRSCAFP